MRIEVLDEHQEAYLAIGEAVHSGVLRVPVALVHVDSHDDLDPPIGGLSCYDTPSRQYVEQNLTPGDFILPLLLKGYVQKVIHVNFEDETPVTCTVGSLDSGGALLRGNIAPPKRRFYPDRRKWILQKTSDIAALAKFTDGFDTVLGIDCDYFAWNRIPRPAFPFAFSAAQKRRLQRNATSDDRFRVKLCVLPHQFPPITRLVFNNSQPWVELLIDYFCMYMGLQPSMIFLSRSVKTGFTPRKFARLIEDRLLKRLASAPPRLKVPDKETLVLSPFVLKKGRSWYSYSTDKLAMQDSLGSMIVQAASRQLPIGAVRERIVGACDGDSWLADYLLLRTIFNLKKAFIIQ